MHHGVNQEVLLFWGYWLDWDILGPIERSSPTMVII